MAFESSKLRCTGRFKIAKRIFYNLYVYKKVLLSGDWYLF